jgi:tRNA-specific 2-thiouridylase
MGLHELANKSESYEICFIPDNDYRSFLRHRVDGLEEKLEGGNFTDKNGKILGKHKGYPFYTIGQRKGLEVALGTPAYVTAIYPESNRVVLGNVDDLECQQMHVRNLNFVKYDSLTAPIEVVTKIRYKDAGTLSTVAPDGNRALVTFHLPVSAIAPGQSAVFYEGDDVVGGGFIDRIQEN